MLYSEKVMDHFRNPRNLGTIENADAVGEVGNAKCGDIMKMYIKVDNDIITDVKFKTFGCGAAIATSSISTEMIKGKTVEEALTLKNSDVVKALDGLPPVKLHCSVLAEEAIHEAIADYYRKEGKLTEGHCKALLGIDDPEKQYQAARYIVESGDSVREAEKQVRIKKKTNPAVKNRYEPIYRDIEDSFRSFFGTKVKIDAKQRSGKIIIQYSSNEDLERILGLVK